MVSQMAVPVPVIVELAAALLAVVVMKSEPSRCTCNHKQPVRRETQRDHSPTAGACGLTAEGQDGHASPPELQDPSPATAGSLLVVGTAPAAVTAHASNGSREVATIMAAGFLCCGRRG